jgi:hypothetical protein
LAPRWIVVYAATTLLGAFLVFQVQPVISKCVLPWFGGTPAVWTTCVLFFQVVLFAGYLYAHLLRTYLSSRAQGIVHAMLLVAAIVSLPIQPTAAWKPVGGEDPTVALLILLATHVALPYFVLSSTGPLVQAWLSHRRSDRSVYRLYALSNCGSLAALVSYPFVVEPWLSIDQQSTLWTIIFCVFATLMGLLALRTSILPPSVPSRGGTVCDDTKPSTGRLDLTVWILLPALASVMLLAITNHLCQDVAVVPFLWVLPLSLYLISFIITFDSPAWYRPKPVSGSTLAMLIALQFTHHLPVAWRMPVEIGMYLLVLLGVCLICHGEVARRQPPTRQITLYYALISLGGAVGGITVAILCPLLFDDFRELAIGSLASIGLAALVFLRPGPAESRGVTSTGKVAINWLIAVGIIAAIAATLLVDGPTSIAKSRNFFGVLRVDGDQSCRRLVHGATNHGMQFLGTKSKTPTSYYGTQSGVGRTIVALQQNDPDLRVGVVGLGCGVLATYGREGECWDFFEINPAVVRVAKQHFSFLRECPAEVRHHLGDGRLMLQRQDHAGYDLLVIDAFSSDSIPAHLLTVEAMMLYRRALTPQGALAIHLSNNHLDLVPLAHRLADHVGLESREIHSGRDDATGTRPAKWLIASNDANLWASPLMREAQPCNPTILTSAPLWTDQHHNLASVLNWTW